MADEPELKRLNADIPKKLHQDFKTACVIRGENMTDVLEKFCMQYVKLSKTMKENKQ